jgi:hypothetical protein
LARLTKLEDYLRGRLKKDESDLTRELAKLGPSGLAFLEARFVFLRRLAAQHAPDRQQFPPGPGRVDAFVTARNLLFKPEDAIPASSPVRFPSIWGLDGLKWLHYDANTNSVIERNIGQALGLGALATSDGSSTVLPRNLHRLEQLARKLQPPPWPSKVFGIDQDRVKRGVILYQKLCAGCHDKREGDNSDFKGFGVYRLEDIGTDPERALTFARPMSDGRPFATVLGEALDKIKKKAYADAKLTPKEQREFDGTAEKSVIMTTKGYAVRPLAGIWAKPPYLHNGSVPTLDDLLRPEGERPVVFLVGQREYDPVKVGFAGTFDSIPADQQEAVQVYRTRLRGNSNRGHSGERFGTSLGDEDRKDLIEYLKVVGE